LAEEQKRVVNFHVTGIEAVLSGLGALQTS
jgi:hypothetical protein